MPIDETTFIIIDRYGLPLIALVCIVFFLWKWVFPKLDQAWNMYVGASEKMEINVNEIFKSDIEISNLLVEVLRTSGANWAMVWQLHNGGTNLNGFPFLRVSATHEQTDIKHDRIAKLYQNLPTSLFIDGTGRCDINKLHSETLCLGENKTVAVRGIMEAHGMSLMQICALRNSKGLMVGFLTVSYSDKDSLSPEDCEQLDKYAERAQILLDIETRVAKLEERR